MNYSPSKFNYDHPELDEYDQVRLPHEQIDNHQIMRTEMMTLDTEFRCPICLDLLKNTMITKCLHRFCSECIIKALNDKHECPSCRRKVIGKRHLRLDPNMDQLINTIWPDKDEYDHIQNEEAHKWSMKNNISLQRSIQEGLREQERRRRNKLDTDYRNDELRIISGQPCTSSFIATPDSGIPEDFSIEHGDEEENNSDNFTAMVVDNDPVDSNDEDLVIWDLESDDLAVWGSPPRKKQAIDFQSAGKLYGNDDYHMDMTESTSFTTVSTSAAHIITKLETKTTSENLPVSSSTYSINCHHKPYISKSIYNMQTMDEALKEYKRQTNPLGVIMVQLTMLLDGMGNGNNSTLTPGTSSTHFNIRIPHSATVEELRCKFITTLNSNHPLRKLIRKKSDIRLLIQMPSKQIVEMRNSESICTVLGLADRDNFMAFPIIYFIISRAL